MIEFIPLGITEVISTDFAVTASTPAGLLLKDGSASDSVTVGGVALIQSRTSAGKYITIGTMDCNGVARTLAQPGTYRIIKRASPAVPVGQTQTAYGLDKD